MTRKRGKCYPLTACLAVLDLENKEEGTTHSAVLLARNSPTSNKLAQVNWKNNFWSTLTQCVQSRFEYYVTSVLIIFIYLQKREVQKL